MSAVGTTLLHSPGWNEGKARYETLGTHRQKQNELRQGAAQQHEHLLYVWKCRPFGAQDMLIDY